MALGADDWIDLQEAKRHLNKDVLGQTDDEELAGFIQAAEAAIVDRIGYVKQPEAALVEYHPGGRLSVRLEQRPVFADGVAEVAVLGTVVPRADRDTDTAGWYVDLPGTGLLKHTDGFPTGSVRVTYTPGYPEIPASIRQAALELLRHFWRTQRGPLGGRPGRRGQESIDPVTPSGTGYLLPHRVEQLLRPYVQVPVA